MRFSVDAQLPRRHVYRLREAGHDALHTLDLPNGNRSTNAQLNALATREGRVVVSKDADFVDSFLLAHQPPKLLLIATGNIRNADLEALLVSQLPMIEGLFTIADFLELTRAALTVRG